MDQLKAALLDGADAISPPDSPYDYKTSPSTRVNAARSLALISQIKNSGFESSTSSLTNWTLASGTAIATTTSPNTGGIMAKLGQSTSGTSSITQTIVANNATALAFNTTYVLSAWVKADAGQTATLSITPAGGSAVATTSTSTSWQRIELKFTTGASTNNYTITLASASSAGNYVYFDDLVVAPDLMSGTLGITKTTLETLTLSSYTNTGPIRILAGVLDLGGQSITASDLALDGGGTITNGTNSKAIALSDLQFLTINSEDMEPEAANYRFPFHRPHEMRRAA
jgi:hypothetical protein